MRTALLLHSHVGTIAYVGNILVIKVCIILISWANAAGNGGVVSCGDYCCMLSLGAGGCEGEGGN